MICQRSGRWRHRHQPRRRRRCCLAARHRGCHVRAPRSKRRPRGASRSCFAVRTTARSCPTWSVPSLAPSPPCVRASGRAQRTLHALRSLGSADIHADTAGTHNILRVTLLQRHVKTSENIQNVTNRAAHALTRGAVHRPGGAPLVPWERTGTAPRARAWYPCDRLSIGISLDAFVVTSS